MRLQYLLPYQFTQAIESGWPLLLPTGCIEYHGPHAALGLDTIIVETLLTRVSKQIKAIVAPPLWYGPTGYAVTGPGLGTADVSTERFGRHVKDVLTSFWDMGFNWIIVGVHHQQMDGPESLAIRQAAAEVIFEKTHEERGDAWWGKAPLDAGDNVFDRIQVWPSVLPAAAEKGVVMADHAGFYETSMLMAAKPDLVDLDQLGMDPPWYTKNDDSKARKANAEDGERFWQAMTEAWVEKLNAVIKPSRPTPDDLTVKGIF
jgi:creatinine amidohydrolase